MTDQKPNIREMCPTRERRASEGGEKKKKSDSSKAQSPKWRSRSFVVRVSRVQNLLIHLYTYVNRTASDKTYLKGLQIHEGKMYGGKLLVSSTVAVWHTKVATISTVMDQ